MLELTNRCNASCDYCYITDKNTQDLPTEKIYAILDKLADAGIMNLVLTGGEPFFRRDILDILAYIIKKDFWKTTFLTNGTLIGDDHIRFLHDYSRYIGIIQLPVFSHIPEIHDKYIGISGALAKILAVTKQLKEAGIMIHIALNVLDINAQTIRETAEFFETRGCHMTLGIHKIIVNDPIKPAKQNKSRLKKTNSIPFLCNMLQHMPEGFILNEKERFFEKKGTPSLAEDSFLCRGLLYTICIDAQGGIRPCSSFRNLTIGNIFNNGSLYELANKSEDLKKIKSLRRSDLQQCAACQYASSCNICIGQIHTETGRFDQPTEQLCNYTKALERITAS